ncbi:MAG: hypothetical protein ABSC50_09400 [Candidatus Bathyarchaeia archaeon]
MRPTSKDPHLFITFRKNDGKWVPVGPRHIGDNVITTARRVGLIKRPKASSSANRYHVHPHEFRDLFKSLCQLNGVLPVASEYFLGHSIDRLGYDKSPQYDVEFFRREYRKVEPFLNILSQREGINENVVKATFNRQFLEMAGYSEDEITQMGDLSEIAAQEIQELIQKKSMQALGLNGNSKQRVVPLGEVKNWIVDGWEFVTALPTEEAVMRLPKA